MRNLYLLMLYCSNCLQGTHRKCGALDPTAGVAWCARPCRRFSAAQPNIERQIRIIHMTLAEVMVAVKRCRSDPKYADREIIARLKSPSEEGL